MITPKDIAGQAAIVADFGWQVEKLTMENSILRKENEELRAKLPKKKKKKEGPKDA